MRSKLGWIFAAILLLVLVVALPLVFRFAGWGWRGGMMGGRGFMEPHAGFFFPMGFLGMGFAMLLPAAFLVLLVLGGVALVNSLARPSLPSPQPPTPSGRTCPNCGKPAQMDWTHCPYCGNALS
jgi:hypothetical protein